MKKFLSLAVLALAGLAGAQAAEPAYEYVPVVREGVEWHNYYYHDNDVEEVVEKIPFVLTLRGDSVIDGQTYKKCWFYQGDVIKGQPAYLVGLLREENKQVERIRTDVSGINFDELTLGRILYPVINANNSTPQVIYDFGDRGYCGYLISGFSYRDSSQIVVGGHLANQYRWESVGQATRFIEGIGYDPDEYYGHLMEPEYYTTTGIIHPDPRLNYVIENGKVIYTGVNYVGVIDYDGIDDVTADSQRVGDGRYYDLTGRPVADPAAPGIYIHNGKKVLVR